MREKDLACEIVEKDSRSQMCETRRKAEQTITVMKSPYDEIMHGACAVRNKIRARALLFCAVKEEKEV
jgi:hypothetical protein